MALALSLAANEPLSTLNLTLGVNLPPARRAAEPIPIPIPNSGIRLTVRLGLGPAGVATP